MSLTSVRARLTLWHAAVLAAIVIAFSGAMYFFVRARVLGELDAKLEENLRLVERTRQEDPGEVEELEHHGAVLLFEVLEGEKVVYRTERWKRGQLDQAKAAPGREGAWSWEGVGGRPYRLKAARGAATGKETLVRVALDEGEARHTLSELRSILLLGIPGALALAVAGGFFLAGKVLAPVRQMAERAERISAENLAERLPVGKTADEFARLAHVFNDALARLHASFEQLRRFTADASHELRTPLTAIRSVGEVALRDPLSPEAYRDVIGSMLEEVDRLARLVDSLLTLTRAEAGRIELKRETVDLGALATGVTDILRILAEEREQRLTLEASPGILARGDPAILRQAFTNLVDNAIKHTPPKGEIRVSARSASDGEVALEVADSGPGIPPEHRERVFERFYRIDEGRSREQGGVGLGLAIARWAVAANGGRIELESTAGRGSTFRIVLPRA